MFKESPGTTAEKAQLRVGQLKLYWSRRLYRWRVSRTADDAVHLNVFCLDVEIRKRRSVDGRSRRRLL